MRVKVAEAADFASDSDCRRLPLVLRGIDFPFSSSSRAGATIGNRPQLAGVEVCEFDIV